MTSCLIAAALTVAPVGACSNGSDGTAAAPQPDLTTRGSFKLGFFVGSPPADQGLYVMEVDGSGRQRVAEVGAVARWSVDGRRIVYSAGDGEIWIMDVDGGGRRRLTDEDQWSDDPAWSPDGRRIAFSAGEPDRYPVDADIYVLTIATGDVVRVTDEPEIERGPVWSPDGLELAFGRISDGARVIVKNLASGEERDLSPASGRSEWPTDWSPDGDHILVLSGGPEVVLFIVHADTGDRTDLADVPVQGGGAWSPDGRMVAFVARDEDFRSHIYTIRPDGTDLRRVTDERQGIAMVDWVPAD